MSGKLPYLALWSAEPPHIWLSGTVGDLLRERAEEMGFAPALHGVDDAGVVRTYTYGEVYEESVRLACALLVDLDPGDTVAICAPNSVAWVLTEFACGLSGIALAPMNPSMSNAEFRHILESSGAKLVLTVEHHRGRPVAARLREVLPTLSRPVEMLDLPTWSTTASGDRDLPDVTASTPLLVQYTSGTTGRPKGAVHTHLSALNAGAQWAADLGLEPVDALLAPVPLYHVGASIVALLGAMVMRSSLVLLPDYTPQALVAALCQTRASVLAAVPTMLYDALAQPGFSPAQVPGLRIVVGGGSAVSADIVREVERIFGVEFVVSFGQSESPAILQTRVGDSTDVKATTLGRPLPGRDVRIARMDGSTARDGEIGEICTRSKMQMLGYIGQPEGSGDVIDDQGWLHTGDLGAMDPAGYVSFHGRAREVIIRGGENLYPAEIEAVYALHPAIAQVAVVGQPDARWGEVPVGFVVNRPDQSVNTEELIRYGQLYLASFKVPRRWIGIAAFPLTASGKIRKVELQQQIRSEG
ncbi:class I adenylate-forming enzyme family protein [Nocardia sp. NBC_01388]|uniref:class I adenylate-forming enzyme family protein n=1 Tax=Nocardia sp. NBC_01388 TaxID=2903596 RepID=UPI00324E53BB